MNPTDDFAIIAFSNLSWAFISHRSHHLLPRLAPTHRIIFIQEPVYNGREEAYWERSTPAPNVALYQPHTAIAAPGFSTAQLPTLKKMLATLLETEGLEDYIVWIYTPSALPLVYALSPRALIYDSTDELSEFLNASSLAAEPRRPGVEKNAQVKLPSRRWPRPN
jgi:UDP-galactopyranose mutase